jgi:hypothetical protein
LRRVNAGKLTLHVIDEQTSHSTKPASWQVAGYPAQAGILQLNNLAEQDNRNCILKAALDSRLRGNDGVHV